MLFYVGRTQIIREHSGDADLPGRAAYGEGPKRNPLVPKSGRAGSFFGIT